MNVDSKHTPGPWKWVGTKKTPKTYSYLQGGESGFSPVGCALGGFTGNDANAKLIAEAPTMLQILQEANRAIGEHVAPHDCYATGPLTGDPVNDLTECPACVFLKHYDLLLDRLNR